MLLNKTTLMAVQTLMYLARERSDQLQSPRTIAEVLGASPSYLAKVTGALVKGEILRSSRGIQGGVALAKSPESIKLLHIFEACQGSLLKAHCEEVPDVTLSCGYHRAMYELYQVNLEIMSRWTLADILQEPFAKDGLEEWHRCHMLCLKEKMLAYQARSAAVIDR